MKVMASSIVSAGCSGISRRSLRYQLNWVDLHVPSEELLVDHTCCLGQSFSWKRLGASGIFVSSVPFPVAVRSHLGSTHYASLLPDDQDAHLADALIRRYFQLDYSLAGLYKEWAAGCVRMREVTACLPGIRVVRQEPWECLMSFICSSNNNVKRISLMLDRIKHRYGGYVCSLIPYDSADADEEDWEVCVDPELLLLRDKEGARASSRSFTESAEGESGMSFSLQTPRKRPAAPATATATPSSSSSSSSSRTLIHLYSFPGVAALAGASEEELRALGMGYRAKFITGSVARVLAEGDGWLSGLRDSRDRAAVQTALLQLPGVGRKVADCVALFSLDQSDAVPVDTHVWAIAARDYDASLGRDTKSLTPIVYEVVGDTFRQRFRSHAGWAHSVLFAAELPEFRGLLPLALQEEMASYAAQQRQLSADKKASKGKRETLLDGTGVGLLDDIPSTPLPAASSSVVVKTESSKRRKRDSTPGTGTFNGLDSSCTDIKEVTVRKAKRVSSGSKKKDSDNNR